MEDDAAKPDFELPNMTKATPGTRARTAFEVTAGLIPGRPEVEYTRRWWITDETWNKDFEAMEALTEEEYLKRLDPSSLLLNDSAFVQFQAEVFAYVKELEDPRRVNWVRLDWVWY